MNGMVSGVDSRVDVDDLLSDLRARVLAGGLGDGRLYVDSLNRPGSGGGSDSTRG